MKNVFLNRGWMTEKYTMGFLKIEGVDHPVIYSLEEPWKKNKRRISCIPEGEYNCEPFSGTRFKGVYHVEEVPDRDWILIHPGNRLKDTQGCILLGLSGGDGLLYSSRNAVKELKSCLGYKPFKLIINNGGPFWPYAQTY